MFPPPINRAHSVFYFFYQQKPLIVNIAPNSNTHVPTPYWQSTQYLLLIPYQPNPFKENNSYQKSTQYLLSMANQPNHFIENNSKEHSVFHSKISHFLDSTLLECTLYTNRPILASILARARIFKLCLIQTRNVNRAPFVFGWNLQGLQLPRNVMASFISLLPFCRDTHISEEKMVN